MNKSGIALAADSAVTVQTSGPDGKGHKVFNTANKLFALSKHEPVALMIYGNAAMLGIPWETIVKMYRQELGRKEFKTLKGYCDDFFRFLGSFRVKPELQEAYIARASHSLSREIKLKLDNWVKEQLGSDTDEISEEQIGAQLDAIIDDLNERWKTASKRSALTGKEKVELGKKYRTSIDAAISTQLENRPIKTKTRATLRRTIVNAASVGPSNQSGIVIAGYGADDLYPSCYEHDVSAVIAGKALRKQKRATEIDESQDAFIIPFAQSGEVRTFMEGIGPQIDEFIRNNFAEIFRSKLPIALVEEITKELKVPSTKQAKIRALTRDICRGAYDEAIGGVNFLKQERFIHPVIDATRILSKEKLAEMAETLVNLVSFRKQVTMESETVGGPIDVAVVTKGDGFVWIKRKHYFPAELNHHFFSNYFAKVNYNA